MCLQLSIYYIAKKSRGSNIKALPLETYFRNKAIIRTHPQQGQGSDYHDLVRLKGLEPTRLSTQEPKSCMSTNSITGAYSIFPLFYIGRKPEVELIA